MNGSLALKRNDLPGFSIGPLETYADPREMRAWIDAAAPGDAITYATVPVLGEQDAAKLARWWAEQGLVELYRKRAERAHCFDYMAQRVSGRGSSRPTPSVLEDGPSSSSNETRTQMRALLQVLRRCAVRGDACPSNAKLATELGLDRGPRGRRRAQYLFERLAAEQRIAVTGCGRNAPRVVTILAPGNGRGRSTAGEGA